MVIFNTFFFTFQMKVKNENLYESLKVLKRKI